jgi:hypothetical protein
MYENILNWRLLAGSHEFPGPDGGSCINEAAAVAAGFEYRAIGSVKDCPPCFSRPIAAFAIRLNDGIQDDDVRTDLLMPFVTRLAGSRDSAKIEKERAKLIVFRVIRDILPIELRHAGRHDYADRCAKATNFNSAANYVLVPRYLMGYGPLSPGRVLEAIAQAVDCLVGRRRAVVTAVEKAGLVMNLVAAPLFDDGNSVYAIGADILREALDLGRQAPPIEVAAVCDRMNEARRQHAMCAP